MRKTFYLFIFIIISYPCILSAQYAVIRGNVTANETPVEGAVVQLGKRLSFKTDSTAFISGASTNMMGYFEFTSLEPGSYAVTITGGSGKPAVFKWYDVLTAEDSIDTGVLSIKDGDYTLPGDSTGIPSLIAEIGLKVKVSILSDSMKSATGSLHDFVINEVVLGELYPGENYMLNVSRNSLQKGLFTTGAVLTLSFQQLKQDAPIANLHGFTDKQNRVWKLIRAEKPETPEEE